MFAAAWAVIVATIAVIATWSLEIEGFDLGFYLRGLAALAAEGPAGEVSFAGWSLLQDHFVPIAFLLLPVLALPSPWLGLTVVQTVAIAASIPVIWRLARRLLGSDRDAWLLTIAYSVAPTVLAGSIREVHSQFFALPFLALMADGIEGRRGPLVIGAAVVAASAGEQAALTVLIISLVFLRYLPRPLAVAGAAGLGFLAVGQLLGPGPPTWVAAAYDHLAAAQPPEILGVLVGAVWAHGAILLLLAVWAIPWLFLGRLD